MRGNRSISRTSVPDAFGLDAGSVHTRASPRTISPASSGVLFLLVSPNVMSAIVPVSYTHLTLPTKRIV